MREILFRGFSTDSGEWVEGFLVQTQTHTYIIQPGWYNDDLFISLYNITDKVDPETVGQFTGLTDKNGKKIFEGDIVTATDEIWKSPYCDGLTGKIIYDEAAFIIEPKDPLRSQFLFNECAVYEVIGNIHDNPELLEGAEDGK